MRRREVNLGERRETGSLPQRFAADLASVNPGWLKQVWGKWPGDESIEELLALLDDAE